MISLSLVSSLALSVSADWYNINDRSVGVQLFQWPFDSIAKECTDFLGPQGYSFVQTSPVQEHTGNDFESNNNQVPWYLTYQPLGYNIGNRLGDYKSFVNMVNTCKNAGVDIVVDVVLNHFSAVNHNDFAGFGTSSGWSSHLGSVSYPDANYHNDEFHQYDCDINWKDDNTVYNCRLDSLIDVNTQNPNVRNRIISFLNQLLDIGVVGFRMDASKCIEWPDLQSILGGLHNNYRGQKPYVVHEVMYRYNDNTYRNYQALGRVLNFEYGNNLGQAFKSQNLQDQNIGISAVFNRLSSVLDGSVSTVFMENHDVERNCDGEFNWALSRYNNAWFYKQAVAFSILYPWGLPQVHSGYDIGFLPQCAPGASDPPSRESILSAPFDHNDPQKRILPVPPIVGNICSGGWTCQHRWSDVFPLVKARNYVSKFLNGLPQIKYFTNNQIYWNVQGKGFFAINNGQGGMLLNVYTGLPSGTYCNQVYGQAVSGECVLWPGVQLNNGENASFFVDSNGNTNLNIGADDKSRVVALYTGPNGTL
ncbi:hypothetical protein HDV06_005661 [Boothiomyces sp. JEL0866]|nr:hypothetical protein HDV06_005661 [Boothiomyces sp. JEL0866]